MLLAAATTVIYSVGRLVTDRHRGHDVTTCELGVAKPDPRLVRIAGRTNPHETTTATSTPPLDGATEPEASSLKLDGNADPEFCGYGVRESPVSIASDADTDSLPELRVKATVSSLPVVGASMGDPRSPTPPTSKWAWSSDEDDANHFRGFLDDCADLPIRHVRRAMHTPCMAHVENEVRACFGTLMREPMEPAFVDEIIK